MAIDPDICVRVVEAPSKITSVIVSRGPLRVGVHIVRWYDRDGDPWVELAIESPPARILLPRLDVLRSVTTGKLLDDEHVGGIFATTFDPRLPPEPELASGLRITPELRLEMPYVERENWNTITDLAEYLVTHLDLETA